MPRNEGTMAKVWSYLRFKIGKRFLGVLSGKLGKGSY